MTATADPGSRVASGLARKPVGPRGHRGSLPTPATASPSAWAPPLLRLSNLREERRVRRRSRVALASMGWISIRICWLSSCRSRWLASSAWLICRISCCSVRWPRRSRRTVSRSVRIARRRSFLTAILSLRLVVPMRGPSWRRSRTTPICVERAGRVACSYGWNGATMRRDAGGSHGRPCSAREPPSGANNRGTVPPDRSQNTLPRRAAANQVAGGVSRVSRPSRGCTPGV